MGDIPAGYPQDQIEAIALLTSREKPSIADMKIMALIEAAGETFYLAAAEAVDNEEAKALLTRNGREERGHAHRLLKVIALLDEPWELPADEDNPYIQPMDLSGMINADLLAAIQQGERDGDMSYQGWADQMDNKEVEKIFRLNGAEETRHGERVAQVAKLVG